MLHCYTVPATPVTINITRLQQTEAAQAVFCESGHQSCYNIQHLSTPTHETSNINVRQQITNTQTVHTATILHNNCLTKTTYQIEFGQFSASFLKYS